MGEIKIEIRGRWGDERLGDGGNEDKTRDLRLETSGDARREDVETGRKTQRQLGARQLGSPHVLSHVILPSLPVPSFLLSRQPFA